MLESGPWPGIETGEFRYSSSIDPKLENLYGRFAYSQTQGRLPVLLVLHGFTQEARNVSWEILTRFARAGVFSCAVGMRGRDGAAGQPDCSGREIFDIFDALAYVRTRFSQNVNPDRAAIVGYSGGGGNALACAAKFPDTFTDIASHFGISDYGYKEPQGWWFQNPSYRQVLEAWIGGSPFDVPNRYLARAHLFGLGNYSGGHLYLFHDAEDDRVPSSQSEMAERAIPRRLRNNVTLSVTSGTDTIRWLHGLPNPPSPVVNTEEIWLQSVAEGKHGAWTVPEVGQVTVLGYLVTKRFTIWLGNGTESVADVIYDTRQGEYAVRPLTGAMTVEIQQGTERAVVPVSTTTLISLK